MKYQTFFIWLKVCIVLAFSVLAFSTHADSYLRFPYMRFPSLRNALFRTCVFRTCVFQYLRFQRPPLNVAFVRRMLDVSLCWVVFDMFVRKCIRFDTCVYSVGLGTLSVACKVAWLVAGQLADIFKSPNSEMTMSGYIWCIYLCWLISLLFALSVAI